MQKAYARKKICCRLIFSVTFGYPSFLEERIMRREEWEKRCQFHQHLTHPFFLQNFWRQNFKPKSQLCTKFWRQKCAFIQKTGAQNVDKIDTRRGRREEKNRESSRERSGIIVKLIEGKLQGLSIYGNWLNHLH